MRTLALIGAIASLLISGCASYHLGQPAELPYRSIEIAPPRNLSTLPQVEGPLNAALRRAILQSGTLSLANGTTSDATLEITILEVRRKIAAVTPEDVGRGRKFELTVDFELTLKESGANGKVFIDARRISLTRDIFTDSGQIDAEYNAVPEISQQIATKVGELLVDRW